MSAWTCAWSHVCCLFVSHAARLSPVSTAHCAHCFPSRIFFPKAEFERFAEDEDEEGVQDSSDLTLGGVVCGNPCKALRMRSRARLASPQVDQPSHALAEVDSFHICLAQEPVSTAICLP